MANDFTVSVHAAVPPHQAWDLAGDPGSIHEWFGPVVATRMDGDIRTVEMASGAKLVERVTEGEPGELSYSYEVLEGIPGLTSHRATLWVSAADRGCTINWRQTATSEVEGYDIEARLGGVMVAGLERLRDVLEGAVGD
ncbi:MAG: SRPBCC family protein [Miltoncostaeaceae bacterium]